MASEMHDEINNNVIMLISHRSFRRGAVFTNVKEYVIANTLENMFKWFGEKWSKTAFILGAGYRKN